jgi:Putative phage tail protein
MFYEEPTTGQLVLKLVRNDYGDPALLPNINPDNARPADGDWYQVQGWSETLNQVRLTFTDRQNNYADGLAVAQNAANATSQDSRGLRSTDIRFVGCCTRELAEKLAARELAALSHPLVTATVIVNRSFHTARPGSVYTLTWPEPPIRNMVMRVVRVDLGQLHKGEITLDLIRDIFDVQLGAFPVPS